MKLFEQFDDFGRSQGSTLSVALPLRFQLSVGTSEILPVECGWKRGFTSLKASQYLPVLDPVGRERIRNLYKKASIIPEPPKKQSSGWPQALPKGPVFAGAAARYGLRRRAKACRSGGSR